jgi:hypothetical protein
MRIDRKHTLRRARPSLLSSIEPQRCKTPRCVSCAGRLTINNPFFFCVLSKAEPAQLQGLVIHYAGGSLILSVRCIGRHIPEPPFVFLGNSIWEQGPAEQINSATVASQSHSGRKRAPGHLSADVRQLCSRQHVAHHFGVPASSTFTSY